MNKFKYYIKSVASVLASVALLLTSCTDSTGNLGIPPANESLETSVAIYDVYSSSMKLDTIKARSVASYLGSIYDPETNGKITGNFATQFAIMEDMNYFPPADSITSRDTNGKPCCDSVMLQLNFDSYFGDVNTPLKIAIYPLDTNNPLCDDSVYYINNSH